MGDLTTKRTLFGITAYAVLLFTLMFVAGRSLSTINPF